VTILSTKKGSTKKKEKKEGGVGLEMQLCKPYTIPHIAVVGSCNFGFFMFSIIWIGIRGCKNKKIKK